MKTKIVYCIVSNDQDIYLEQAWVSIYTLKNCSPEAEVFLIVDKETESTLVGKRAGIKELITEVIAVETPDGYNAMQRSRYLKTNFRQFIAGDLLFIDADTVIGGSLEGIDKIDAEIACVPDGHRRFNEKSEYEFTKQRISSIFGSMEFDSDFYFNSGVIYVKDTPRMHTFFTNWYERWKYSSFEKNCLYDQPSLFVTDKMNGYIIRELPGFYNCQIAYSLKYLYGGVILHLFNGSFPMLSSEISVFYDTEFYRKIKEYGSVAHEVKEILDDKSMWFNVQTNIVDSSHADFLCTYVGYNIYKSYREKKLLYKLNEKVCVYKFMIRNYTRLLKQRYAQLLSQIRCSSSAK